MSHDRARRGGLTGLLAGAGPGLGGSCAGCLGAGSTAGAGVAAGWIGIALGVAALVVLGARQVRRCWRARPTARSRRRVVLVQVGALVLSALAGFLAMQALLVLYAHSLTRISTH